MVDAGSMGAGEICRMFEVRKRRWGRDEPIYIQAGSDYHDEYHSHYISINNKILSP
jgi:hypothetical protein